MKPEALSQEFSGIVAASSDRGQCIESFYLKICIHCKTQHHPSSTRSASVLLDDQEVDDTASLSCGLHLFLISRAYIQTGNMKYDSNLIKPLT